MSNKPAVRSMPGGGFQQGIGQFNEHLDEQAMQQAVKQQALAQQASTQTGPAPLAGNQQSVSSLLSGGGLGGSATDGAAGLDGLTGAGAEPGAPGGQGQEGPQSPSFFDTIISQPVQDLAKTILEALHLDKILGLSGKNDTPQDKAKKQAMMRRYNELTQEEQAVAREKFQRRQQEEKMRLEEEQRRKQIEEQQRAQTLQIPTKAPRGPGSEMSHKSRAVQQLEHDRKTLNAPQSAG